MSASPVASQLPSLFARNGIPVVALSASQVEESFLCGLEMANLTLKQKGIEVVFIQQVPEEPKCQSIDPGRDILLGIKQVGTEGVEPIDIIDLKALREDEIKTPLDLMGEIVKKANQHLVAKTTSGIVFSSSGSKFDTRQLQHHSFGIDDKGYATMDSHRLALETPKGEFLVVQAASLRSYTILRLINEEEDTICITDDYDLVRNNSKGMVIQTTVYAISKERLLPRCQGDAKDSDGYLLIKRPALTEEKKERIHTILQTFRP